MSNKIARPWTFLQILSIPLIMACIFILVLISSWFVDLATGRFGLQTHGPVGIYGFASVCTFLSLWLVLGAVFAYLNVGQAKKLEIITGFYTPDTVADYFDQFWSGRDGIRALIRKYREADGAAKDGFGSALGEELRKLFAAEFGLQVYIVPLILLAGAGSIVLFFGYTGGIGLAVALGSGQGSPVQPMGITLDLVTIAAIFGAFTWVASDVIVRNHQWTLHPSDLAWYALRLIVAVPLGHALALMTSGGADISAATTNPAVVPASAGAFVAFVASMFSLDSITAALGTTATRFGLPMTRSTEERDDLIVKLAGVDEEKARALNVEGVSTIAQLVTVDPIRTSIRTGLPFEYVLRLVDAALLWVFAGDKLKSLHPLGLRGASDVLALDDIWRVADVSATVLNSLRQAQAALAEARDNDADAQKAFATVQAVQPPADPAVLAPVQVAATSAAAAVAVALTLREAALGSLLGTPDLQLKPEVDRSAMLVALAIDPKDGGPGLTAIGFAMIALRLRQDGYAAFVKRLLES